MRKMYVLFVVATGALVLALLVGATRPSSSEAQSYVVVYHVGSSTAAARNAVHAAGGTIVKENLKVGVATVVSRNPNFLERAQRQDALFGAARNRPIGHALGTPSGGDAELAAARGAAASAAAKKAAPGAEPLANLQWDMQMIHATVDGSYAVERGDKNVLVGIIDTGVDGSHPDIAPNFSRKLSRNFTTDIPFDPNGAEIDGPCDAEPDHSCNDAADVDENGHGTHVASTIGSPINGVGIAGVAPNVTLVNVRAGQDSGFFFLQPSVDALTYAGDRHLDVVNMSYFIDPWLFNCAASTSDSASEQAEQRTIIAATQRALDYAHDHGVTLVASAGNEHIDYGKPVVDTISPDFPLDSEHRRDVNNSCLVLPTEGNNVLSVVAIGPSKTKADYSSYGFEHAEVAAPGGYFRDLLGTPQHRTVATQVLAAMPLNVAQDSGVLNADGSPNTPFVVRDCSGGTCSYYQYLQGTSMASPHTVGVVALIASRMGHDGNKTAPASVQQLLRDTAVDTPCPDPPLKTYTDVGRPAEFNALCEGTAAFNGFYGYGIVDALRAAQLRPGN